jgi:hypothetical protein
VIHGQVASHEACPSTDRALAVRSWWLGAGGWSDLFAFVIAAQALWNRAEQLV